MSRLNLVLALVSFFATTFAAFDATSNTNVAIYWGQGPNQARLVETCMNPNVDIVIIAFVNVFPDDSGSGGYPGTNFGNACEAGYYTNSTGGTTELLSDCPYIGPDIITCQETYGKKVLLSLGGSYPTDQFIGNNAQAVKFAKFMWGAFGPETEAWVAADKPRPFGNASVDGFDFDIESDVSPVPTWNGKAVNNYKTRGYAKMITTFKNVLFPKDTSKDYYISGAPQCIVPDAHLGPVVKNAWFDFLFIQFYNTPECSARTGVNYIEGNSTENISYDTWADVDFFNPDVKLYIGLPASTAASGSSDYYLPPADAKLLLKQYVDDTKFGGVMLWEATYGAENVVCGKNYPTWIKKILNKVSKGKKINTTTDDCPDSGETCGTCPAIPVSANGHCGANYGTTCSGSTFGSCCTADGTCSSDTSSCSSSCDSSFSDCSSSSKFLFKRQATFGNTTTVSSSATLVSGSSTVASSSSIMETSAAANTTVTADDVATSSVAANTTSASSSSYAVFTISANTTAAAETTAAAAATTADADATATTADVAATAGAATGSSSVADPTAEVISSTLTSTIYQTVYITTVIADVTSTITVVEPLTTQTITVDITVVPAAVSTAVTVTTVTSYIIEHITSTVTALPSTSTVTDYSTVSVVYASGAAAAASSAASSSADKSTSTLSLTVTDTTTNTITLSATPSVYANTTSSSSFIYANTTTVANTTTSASVVVQYVTVVPIAAEDDAVVVKNAVAKHATVSASATFQELAASATSSSATVVAATGAAARLGSVGSWTVAGVVGVGWAVAML